VQYLNIFVHNWFVFQLISESKWCENFVLLSFRYRYEHYESMGELFRAMNAECLQQTLDERLWGLFLELLQEICEALEKDIDELFELIMNCPKTAELVSKMLAPPLREAV